jgi:hypothetical protein
MLIALAMAGVLTIPVRSGAETGTVVFRVTLRGAVAQGDAFSVYRVADPAQWVDSSQAVCNPPDWSADPRAQQPTCAATTYETSVSGAVGARVDYSLLRDREGQPVAFEEHQDGSLTIEPGTQVVTLTFTYAGTPFDDLGASQFKNEIAWLYQSGITGGCAATRFCPTNPVSRGQMAAFLGRALPLPNTGTDFFDDDDGTLFERDINRLAAAGITGGCATRRYCPNSTVSRDEMASFLTRAFGLPQTSTDFFTDDNMSIHEASINRLAAAGITGGCAAGRYCPKADVTREQMAGFLDRALN